jgi:hypothetical protein
MKFFLLCCAASAVSPIEKVLQLLGDLEAKIVKDGEAQQKIYEEFTDHCSDTSKELQFAIKTGKSDAERFSAAAADATAEIQGLEAKIGDLGSSVASNEQDLKQATEIRNKEHADFLEADKDAAESVSMLRRAIAIIEKEMSKTSLLQADSDAANRVAIALQSVVAAAGVNAADKQKIQALLQADDFQPAGAPAPDAYENQSGGILETLEDMLEKAEAQQADAQKSEMTAAHNFAMLKQGLEDAIKNQGKEMAEAKKAKALAEEAKAEAEGELERTNTQRAADEKTLKDLQHECMTTAEEYEQESKERADELGALAAAKKILNEKTGGAADRTYSFLQQKATLRSRAQLRLMAAGDKVVALIQQLGRQEKQQSLAQLAAKVRASIATEADPFGKVKGMIQEMVEKLVKEAAEEAEHKAFCDKEMSETKAKMEDKQGEVDDLNTKVDKFTAKIAKLVEAIATLESEIAETAAQQKHADELRAEQKEAWATAKADFDGGLEGVQMALQVLRDYYAEKDSSLLQTSKETGAASGIIGMLEVAESDFAKMLAEGQAAEDQAIKEYDALTQDNKVSTASKRTELKYSEKDQKETQALLEDTKSDLGVSQEELDAIMEYWEKLQPQCVAKPEPYEERKARREREIAGLKDALEILENESAPSFLQRD